MKELYSDLNETNPTKKTLLKDVEAIYQSLDTILTTSPNERLFSDFGADLEADLFELNDSFTEDDIFSKIIEGVEKYEPRVTVDRKHSTVVRDPDANLISIDLQFAIQGIENQSFNYARRLTLG